MSLSDINGFDRLLGAPAVILAKNIVDSDNAKEKIKDIIKQVFVKLSDPQVDVSKANEFLSKIKEIDKEVSEKTHTHIFKKTIERFTEKLGETGQKPTPTTPQTQGVSSPKPPSTPKPSSSLTTSSTPPPKPPSTPKPPNKISQLSQAFEKATTESPAKPTPTTSTVPKRVIIETPVTLATVRDKINGLDLQSDTLSEKIQGIQNDLNKLEKAGGITPEQKKTLSEALKSLHSPDSFKPSHYETAFLDHCAEKNLGLKKAMEQDLTNGVKRAQQEGRSEMFKAIKNSLKTPETLVDTITKKRDALETELPKLRFSNFSSVTNSPPFNKNFVKNLPQVLQAFESFSKKALKSLESSWKEILMEFEKIHNNQFAKLLKNYPSHDPAALYNELLTMMQEDYLKLFDLNTLNDQPQVKEHLNPINAKAEEISKGFFDKSYQINFAKMHLWLSDNFAHIEKRYDQSTAIHTNLGEGVCFQNSLDRHKHLVLKPGLASSDIQMGSSEAGRATHAKHKQEIFYKKKKGALQKGEAFKIQTESAKRLKLKLVKSITVPPNPEDPTKNLGSTLDKAYQESRGKVLSIFALSGPGRAHAINIQMDLKAGKFRFLDDNLGICGNYGTYEEFRDEFINYLQASYEDFNSFELQFYESTK